ncbi:hypothetical protein NMG60_11012664 [Bertholletia excelsa]
MQGSTLAKYACQQILRSQSQAARRQCDVFISHRRIDTNRNVAGLLYDGLARVGIKPFLDNKTMKPGDRLFDMIDAAIKGCKVGVAVLSPHYCESFFCLHELTMLMECRKRVVPVFVDVKPSELQVADFVHGRTLPEKEQLRFSRALEEAKFTVGLTFDSSTGDWSDLLEKASAAVMENLLEIEEERKVRMRQKIKSSL